MTEPTSTELFRRLEELNGVGIALSKVKDTNRLLEAILLAAKKITNADGGTLYRVDADKKLVHFEILRTDSLNIAWAVRQEWRCRSIRCLKDEGLELLGWRSVPVANACLSDMEIGRASCRERVYSSV